VKQVAVFGVAAGLLIAAMQFVQYRFLVVEHSIEIYGAIVAACFAAAGIWLGLKITRKEIVHVHVPVTVEVPVEVRVPAGEPFAINSKKLEELAITARELEVLQLIAEGLSTKQMAERLFVSENTIKTHCSRVYDKLGASRRTQAVQVGKQLGLLP
jgi:DNA-binding CsgD family transcriptional regulator